MRQPHICCGAAVQVGLGEEYDPTYPDPIGTYSNGYPINAGTKAPTVGPRWASSTEAQNMVRRHARAAHLS